MEETKVNRATWDKENEFRHVQAFGLPMCMNCNSFIDIIEHKDRCNIVDLEVSEEENLIVEMTTVCKRYQEKKWNPSMTL